MQRPCWSEGPAIRCPWPLLRPHTARDAASHRVTSPAPPRTPGPARPYGMLGFGLPFPAQGPLPLHPHTPATGLPTRPADPQLGVAVPGTPDPVIPLVPMRAMAELRKLQRGSPSLGLGCFLNLGCDQAQATRAPNTRGRTPKSWRQDCTLSPGPRRPFRRSRGLHHAQGSLWPCWGSLHSPLTAVHSRGPWGPHRAPGSGRAGPTLSPWDTSSRHPGSSGAVYFLV